MFSPVERLIAFRYLRSKKKEGAISMIALFSLLGVALGVAALIVVMAVMNGFHKEISAKMTGFNGDVLIYGLNGSIDNYAKITENVKGAKGVRTVAPIIEGQVMATANKFSSGSLVRGITIDDLKNKPLIADNIVDGSIDQFDESDSVIIGYELANTLSITVGDKITLISPRGTNTVIGMIPRVKVYNVVALFKSDMHTYDSSTVFMPLRSAQLYFQLKDKVNIIEVMTVNKDLSSSVVEELSNLLGNEYRIADWKITNATYFNVLKTERVVMFIILALIIVVASFNIISSLIMLVNDKSKDIAILRTMGASQAMILRIFVLCGSIVGLIGTSLGLLLGLGFALNIERIRIFLESMTGNIIFDPVVYYLSALPADVQLDDVVRITCLSLALSFLSTIQPARKAAKLDPVKGLSNE